MKFPIYVIMDKRGRVWRFTNRQPAMYRYRKDAVFDALALDHKRGWKAKRAEVQVGEK